MADGPVKELRVAFRVEDYDGAVRRYRDALGLPAVEEWEGPTGRGVVLDAGRATLELLSTDMVEQVDEIEAGGTPSGLVRLALEVEDSAAAADALVGAGAERIGGPVETPWHHRNVRLRDPDGLQLTLFTVLDQA
jgi:catechol 2,3-dioxygenase-like lactoylglutathione lyase family enzyme